VSISIFCRDHICTMYDKTAFLHTGFSQIQTLSESQFVLLWGSGDFFRVICFLYLYLPMFVWSLNRGQVRILVPWKKLSTYQIVDIDTLAIFNTLSLSQQSKRSSVTRCQRISYLFGKRCGKYSGNFSCILYSK